MIESCSQLSLRSLTLKLTFLVAFSLFCSEEVLANTTCRTEIFYRWKVAESSEEKRSLWTLLSASADSPGEARRILEQRMTVEKARAEKECERQHERVSVCISSKLLYRGASLKSLDFSARRMVEESIKEECESRNATCMDALHSEISCIERKETEATAEEGGEGEKAGKDEKKKDSH